MTSEQLIKECNSPRAQWVVAYCNQYYLTKKPSIGSIFTEDKNEATLLTKSQARMIRAKRAQEAATLAEKYAILKYADI